MNEPPETSVDERRSADREPSSGPLHVAIDAASLAGAIQNVSESGVLFTSEEPLRVEVRFQEDGDGPARRGRLVRVQVVDGRQTAYAIEFDA